MKSKNNTVIAILLACILIMSIGYAALAQRLSINGTSRITSTWGVEIIGITSKATGEVSNVTNTPTYTSTTATFNTNLVNPGDKMEYTITVKNTGTLDAIIESVNLEHDNNPAINYTMDGIIRGYTLTSNETIDLKLTIEYDETVTTQPENISASATLIINAVQLHNSDITPVEKPTPSQKAADMLTSTAVTTGDGLYADSYENGRYIYKGSNPNNYISFNNEVWRILSVENDGAIKIVRNDFIGRRAWDSTNNRPTENNSYCTNSSSWGCNAWASTSNLLGTPDNFTLYNPNGNKDNDTTTYSGTVTKDSSLNTYLNTTYLATLDQTHVISHDWGVSTPGNNSDTESLTLDIAQEKDYIWNGMVGLISATEYMRATTSDKCTSLKAAYDSGANCGSNNWLKKSSWYWTISPYVYSHRYNVWNVNSSGNLSDSNADSTVGAVFPAIYLESDIQLTGIGENTEEGIYRIVEN